MRNPRLWSVVIVIALFGSACAARYERKPATIVPPPTMAVADTTETEFEVTWWRQFRDPVLDRLVAEALTANRDLRAAALRYEAALQLAGAAALLQVPQGGAAAGGSVRRLSEAESGAAAERTNSVVHTGFGMAWEADVFGRLRGVRRAAAADAAAAAMDARGVQVAIAAQVASAYFELRGAERDRELIDGLQARSRQQIETTRALIAGGRVTRLDLLRAQQVEEELAAAGSAAMHRAERARNRLATLTGQTAGSLAIDGSLDMPLRAQSLAIGTPAQLLKRRPDVAAAESRVAAAAERAGVARAELFPRVEVTGTIGLVAGSVGRLTEAAAGSWLIAPRIAWNVLDWPRLRRQLRAAGALADAAFSDYEQAVLEALEESRSALDAYVAANRELAALERRAQASADAAAVVLVQYREGLVDSLVRTQADRDAIAGALDANRALTVQRLAVVDVYRAFGGGWQ